MILYIFPEAGLVLFMSLYQWVSSSQAVLSSPIANSLTATRATTIFMFTRQGNRTYGVVELSLWLVRVLSNVRPSLAIVIFTIFITVIRII